MVDLDKNYNHHDDIFVAHKYRLSLDSVPIQSSFRVIAVLFYQTIQGDDNNSTKNCTAIQNYVVGTNDEPCHISGSICAERAALVQLRFLPIRQITKIIIATDAPHEIPPGALCREYLASHNKIPWDTPIILSGTQCRCCQMSMGDSITTYADKLCCHSSIDASSCNYLHAITSVRKLYPYPSPYVRFKTKDAMNFGKNYSLLENKTKDHLNKQQNILLQEAVNAAKLDLRVDLHPIQYGCAVLFSDGSISTASQKKALEYGCTLDPVTQLANIIEQKCYRKNINNKDEIEIATNKLKSTIRPVLLVQADQFGIAHAPFAKGRAFLTEYGYGDCKVLVQNNTCTKWIEVEANDLVPMTIRFDEGLLLSGN